MSKFVHREGGVITYAGEFRAGYAEEELPDDHDDLLPFEKPRKLYALQQVYAARISAGHAFTDGTEPKVAGLTTDRMQVVMGAAVLVLFTALTDAGIMEELALPQLQWPPQDLAYETQDGTFASLSRAEAVTLAFGILQRMVGLNGRRAALAKAIKDAQTMADLNLVPINTGWPN